MRTELDLLLDTFAPSEVYAVLFVARRLAQGRQQYGILNPLDGRRWSLYRAEELADSLVYDAAEEMSNKVLTGQE